MRVMIRMSNITQQTKMNDFRRHFKIECSKLAAVGVHLANQPIPFISLAENSFANAARNCREKKIYKNKAQK